MGHLAGYLGPSWGYLELSWAIFGPTWGQLGAIWILLGILFESSIFLGTILGASAAIFRLSWPRLCAVLKPFWPLLGPSWHLLGHLGVSWAILWAILDHLGALWGHLGRSLGQLAAIWSLLGALCGLLRPTLAEGDSEKVLRFKRTVAELFWDSCLGSCLDYLLAFLDTFPCLVQFLLACSTFL